ncbi:MAG: lipopolysaccharide transport periplasmic protein LptA [Pseudomonadota bacterium]|jgi:lipopolysaccharide export system protein LptA
MPTHPVFLRRLLPFFSVLAGLLCSVSLVWADTADRLQPLNAEADALRYEAASQTSVFSGNVVITKGSILMRADRIEVRQDQQGNHWGGMSGNPAFFRQKRNAVDEFMEGQAQRIEYDSKADTVRFTGNAVLRRYKGSQLNDETSGSVITYNNSNDTFSVEGGSASRTPDNPTGRVRAMLTPAPKTTPTTPPAASPPVPSAAPAPLRPSAQMGEGRP